MLINIFKKVALAFVKLNVSGGSQLKHKKQIIVVANNTLAGELKVISVAFKSKVFF